MITLATSHRACTLLSLLVVALALAACEVPLTGPFEEYRLTTPRIVPFVITSNDLLPNQDLRTYHYMGYRSYAPLLDYRRRIVANSWVRSATLWGPIVPGLRLAWDQCQENEVSLVGLGFPCTAVTTANQDRIEFGWRSVSTPSPIAARTDAMNRAISRATLSVPTAVDTTSGEGLSLAWPGALLRFVSGPPVIYIPPPRWSDMTDPPRSEGRGFVIDAISLSPAQGRGSREVPIIAPYEQVSGVLFGDDSDAYRFALEPSENAQSVAIWFQKYIPTSSVTTYAKCGALPEHFDFDERQPSRSDGVDGPIFLEFRAGECTTGWYIVIASEPRAPVADIVFHFTVAERFQEREWREIKVGIEMPTSGPDEERIIRQSLRWAAWRFYGLTGGTQIIRSFRYEQSGACSRVDLCWRNRPSLAGCLPNSGFVNYVFGDIHICSDARDENLVSSNSTILAHEFGHLFARLDDEYFKSWELRKTCGEEGVLFKRCSHSAMTFFWSTSVNSLCTAHSHHGAPDLRVQNAHADWASFSFNVLGPNTIAECWDERSSDRPGFSEPSAWDQMAGIVPRPHPDLTPNNYDYNAFAKSTARNEIGLNLN